MRYFVEDIQFKQTGETRIDGKYPKRIGSEIEFLEPIVVGKPSFFRYVKYNNGNVVEDHVTRTSIVNDYDNYSTVGKLFLYTKNSIYVLKEI